MNFILYLLITAYFYILRVNCRSVQLDSDTQSALDVIPDKDGNHDTESSGIFSWIRLKPILRREVHRVNHVKGEARKLIPDSTETESSIPSKEDNELLGENVHVHKHEEILLKEDSQINNTSTVKSELAKHDDPYDNPNIESSVASNTTQVKKHEMNHPLISNDFPQNILSNILNQSSESLLLQALNDNSSDIDFDETSLLSGGGHIAAFQEVSTIGFELLIDSETKQNLILAELLNAQSNVIDDDDDDDLDDYSDEDDVSELQEAVANAELGTDKIETSEFDVAVNKTELSTDEDKIENSEFDTNEDETQNPDFGTGEIRNVSSELELSASVQSNNVTKIPNIDPKCPNTGWCIMWFMAIDLCAKDSHCHGSLICCTIGCSKTCVDPVNELL